MLLWKIKHLLTRLRVRLQFGESIDTLPLDFKIKLINGQATCNPIIAHLDGSFSGYSADLKRWIHIY